MDSKRQLRDISVISSQRLKERDYWLKKLAGFQEKSIFPYDYNKTSQDKPGNDSIRFDFTQELFSKIMGISNRSDIRLFILLVSGLNILLGKYSYNGTGDIIVGAPIYKQDFEAEFINTLLILRNEVRGDMTFKDLLLQVSQTIKEATENQNYPIETLLYHLNMSEDRGDFLLFDIVILLENLHEKKYINHVDPNVTFSFARTDEGLKGVLEYNPLLYERKTFERVIRCFLRVLKAGVFNPDVQINNIDILSKEEKQQLLFDFNGTKAGYPEDETVHHLFEAQVEKSSLHTAVIIEDKQLTYSELNKRGNGLARKLGDRGIEADKIAAVMIERSLEMIIGILAILKAGGAYLPIDPGYPDDRIKFMLADSAADILVTRQDLANSRGFNKKTVYVEEVEGEEIYPYQPQNPGSAAGPMNMCYVIYTSGTTGIPKGMIIEHRNVVSLMVNDGNLFDFSSSDTWTMFHSYIFDFSVWEMYGALLFGGKLVVIPEMVSRDPEMTLDVLEKDKVTVLNQTPSAFYNLANLEIKSPAKQLRLRYIIFGGEALNPAKLKEWKNKYPGIRLINMYGITETTVHVTYKLIQDKEIASNVSNIGRPIPTLSNYIVDHHFNLLPIGIPGELLVAGSGLGRGYLNRPGLTKEKFVNSAYIPGQRLYRSGDLGRFLENGEMEYLGRIDHQVKIRGFRIELGEIENQLLNHKGIEEAVVLAGEDNSGDKYICAYLVTNQKPDFSIADLREHLSRGLPDYMVPSYFIEIEKIPLTSNGKIDRKALPAVEVNREAEYTTPRNTIEKKLAEIWSQLLGTGETSTESLLIGIDDNFFQLGGHSLKATNLISKIHKAFNVKVPLAEIFIKPTIRELSRYIEAEEKERYVSIEPVEKKEYYRLSSAQRRLYLLHQLDVENIAFNVSAAIMPGGALEKTKLENVFRQLIHRHESFRTSFHTVRREPVQKIHEEVEFAIEYYEVGGDKGSHTETLLFLQEKNIVKNFIRPFDLSRAPLLRVALIHTRTAPYKPSQEGSSRDRYILVVDMYHIISDGVSVNILEKEFKALYNGEELPALRIQYKEFSRWQNRLFESGEIRKQEQYWLKQLEEKVLPLNLPIDYPRPEIQSPKGDSVRFELSTAASKALKAMASEENATSYILLLAIFNVFLSKICRQEDIVVGTVLAGRRHADLDQIIGFFVNILPMRSSPNGEKTFIEYLREVKASTIKAFENQDYQFEELVTKAGCKRDLSRHPIYDVDFTLQNMQEGQAVLSEPLFKSEVTRSHIDLTLTGVEAEDMITFNLEYCKKLFKPGTIEKFIRYFKAVIADVIKCPGKKIEEIDMIPEEEKARIYSRIQRAEESLVVEFDI